jgi:hypothetical protein
LRLICSSGLIARHHCSLASTTGQYSQIQILIHFADVVVAGQSQQPISGTVHIPYILANYPSHRLSMDLRQLPTQEMIIRNGQPIWRVCGQGYCVEDASGTRAMAAFRALCSSRGIEAPCTGPVMPCRGPSEVDEPGV